MSDSIRNDDELPGMLPDMLPDEPLDPRLLDAARAYHPPPATPREAMWARIAAARAAGTSDGTPVTTPGHAAPAGGTRVVPLDAARARRHPPRTWAVVAAALAAGVAVGVFGGDLLRPRDEAAPVVATSPDAPRARTGIDTGTRPQQVADATAPFGPGTGPIGPVGGPDALPLPGGPATPDAVVGAGAGGASRPSSRAGGPPPDINIAPRTRSGITTRPRSASPDRETGRDAGLPAVYHAAALQTLSQAEALLVAWRVDAPRDTAAARQIATWARDVLGSTRLLLDSPAARDAGLRDLLDDLELVLAQIVQRSGQPLTDDERRLLERSVDDRDLMPRLRSAVPAGAAII